MTVRLSAPSKTFLTGEYAVLAGGPALMINTQPRFELIATKDSRASFVEGAVDGIPQGSPAWLWLEQRAPLLDGWRLSFKDPHEGKGGLGASSAQFLTVHSLTTLLQTTIDRPPEELSFEDLWNDYQVLTHKSGSGADILSQLVGGVARVEPYEQAAEAEAWPYPEIGFTVLRTGRKLATHEHLRDFDRTLAAHLISPAREVFDSFDADSADIFIDKVDAFSRALRELNLQSPLTVEKLNQYEKQDWCLAAKGCGAWGADTILILHPTECQREVLQFSATQDLAVVATAFDVSAGLEVETDAG